MVVARSTVTRDRGAGGRGLPEREERRGAHDYAGKRVRHDVTDGLALLVFSLAISVGVALVLTMVLSVLAG